MSSSSAQTGWFVDSRRNLRFRYDAASDRLVYEDGSSCQRPSSMPRATFDRRAPRSDPPPPITPYTTNTSGGQQADPPRTGRTENTLRAGIIGQQPAPYSSQGSSYTTSPPGSSSTQGSPQYTTTQPIPIDRSQSRDIQASAAQLSGSFQSMNIGSPPGSRPSYPSQQGQGTSQSAYNQQAAQPGSSYQSQTRDQVPASASRPQSDRSNAIAATTGPAPVRPPQVQPRVYERDGMRIVVTSDPRSQLTTSIATQPANRVTDPTLYNVSGGKSSRGLLLGNGNEGEQERLYSTFKVRSHNFFCLGRVFLVLWVEPAGATVVTSVERNDGIIPGRYEGELIYSKVRRFVVIREGAQYCSVLPIMSYGRRGVGKAGVIKSDHAIIYTGHTPPAELPSERPAPGELGMRQTPIRVVPDDPTDLLDPMSRIDFAQVHTVQHNVKVRPLGMVHQNSTSALHAQFSNVWRGNAAPSVPSSQQSTSRPRASEDGVQSDQQHSHTLPTSQAYQANQSTGTGTRTTTGDQYLRQQDRSQPRASTQAINSYQQSQGQSAAPQERSQARSSTSAGTSYQQIQGQRTQGQPAQGQADMSAMAQSAREAYQRLIAAGNTREAAINQLVDALQSSNSQMTREAAINSVIGRLQYQQRGS